MDMDRQVLIAEEFWDKIGGQGTYEELLRILAEIKQEMPLKWEATLVGFETANSGLNRQTLFGECLVADYFAERFA